MRFGKTAMFFIINGIIALILLLHLGRWVFSTTTTAQIIPPVHPDRIELVYEVNGSQYRAFFLRNDIPLADKQVTVRYLDYNPSVSRIDSFLGIYAEPLAWWLVMLIATSMLFFTNNAIFSKGTVFQLHKKFPWISMEEYFPLPKRWRWRYRKDDDQTAPDKEMLN